MAFISSKALFIRHKYPISKSTRACLLKRTDFNPSRTMHEAKANTQSNTLEPLFAYKFQVSFNRNSHKRLKMRQLRHLIFVTAVELRKRSVGAPGLPCQHGALTLCCRFMANQTESCKCGL